MTTSIRFNRVDLTDHWKLVDANFNVLARGRILDGRAFEDSAPNMQIREVVHLLARVERVWYLWCQASRLEAFSVRLSPLALDNLYRFEIAAHGTIHAMGTFRDGHVKILFRCGGILTDEDIKKLASDPKNVVTPV